MAEGEFKYRTICDTLKSEILGGRYSSGRRFPSEAQLVRRFGGSRITVIHALQELSRLGLIVRRKGQGSFLTRRAVNCGRSIGMIIPISRGEIFPPICREITRLAQQDGYSIQLADFLAVEDGERLAESRRIAESFVAQGVLGVIFHLTDGIPDAARINETALKVFDDAGIPVVLTDSDVAPYPERSRYDVVGADDVDAGYRLTLHLIELGAKRILFFLPKFGGTSFTNRCRGFRVAIDGVSRVRGAVFKGLPEDVAAVRRLLRKGDMPDAIICGNDRVAAALMTTLVALGKRVPEDIRVAGFDDVNFARLVSPGLTTMHQPCAEIGATAYRTLLARVENPGLPPRSICLTAPLVVRASTDETCITRYSDLAHLGVSVM